MYIYKRKLHISSQNNPTRYLIYIYIWLGLYKLTMWMTLNSIQNVPKQKCQASLKNKIIQQL